MKRYLTPVIIILGAAVSSAYLWRFSEMNWIVLPLVLGLLPLFAVAVVSCFLGLEDYLSGKQPFYRRGFPGYLALICLASALVFLNLKRTLFLQGTVPAQHFAAALIPKLETYRQAHGTFPRTLSEAGIEVPNTLPFTLLQYRSTKNAISFQFWDVTLIASQELRYDGILRDWTPALRH